MLLVFSDDWGRHPSSCQHLVQHCLPNHRVAWVNTIGMRPPRINLSTVQRGWEKLRHWSHQVTAESSSDSPVPQVINPRMWPWFRRKHDRWLNQHLLCRSLVPLLEAAGEPVYAVTTIPIVADLIGRLPVERWTYYCVDDFSVWPGLDQATMAAMEQGVIAKCDATIAVSDTLMRNLSRQGATPELITHGVDLDFWQANDSGASAGRLQSADKPLIVFWGVIDQRMDVEWVQQLSQRLGQGTILLVGPLDNPDPQLLKLPHVTHMPAVSITDLPGIARRADVLVMPYADLPVTRAMQPLKLKEYLATQKAVVVRDLPAVASWRDCLDVAHSADDFATRVLERVATSVPSAQLRARERLTLESWSYKAKRFEQIVLGNHSTSSSTKDLATDLSC